MKVIFNIAKNELRQLFYSPIAWILLAIFFVQAGAAFSEVIGMLLRYRSLGFGLAEVTNQIFRDAWSGIYPSVQGWLFLYIPLVTMGIICREKTSGTDRLLLSSPVSEAQVVTGKFLSMAVYGLAMLSCLLIDIAVCCVIVKSIDIGPVLSGFLGLYLLLLAYAAIGIFMSSLTRYQIIAAVGTIAVLFGINYLTTVGQGIPVIREIAYWVGIAGRADTFIQGMICSEDLIYFLAIIGLFLTLTVLKLKSGTRSRRRMANAMSYMAAVAVFCAVGFFSSRPVFKFYLDTTRMKVCTLTEESQEVMKQMDGPLTITTYVNLTGPDAYYGLPRNYTRDVARFAWYTRFKPEIKMKYVYYWHPSEAYPLDNKRFEGLDDYGKAQKMADISRVNLKRFLTPEEIAPYDEKVGLAEEDWSFVRTIERGDGSMTKLRLYDDQNKHPGETEITAAMKRLITDVPVVGVLAGHGERSISNIGDKGYYSFGESRTFRHALINQGFDVKEVTITEDGVPGDISVLMIADPREDFSDSDIKALGKYIEEGGDLFIAAKPSGREKLAPVLEMLGVDFMDGILVQESSSYAWNLIRCDLTPESVEASKGFGPYIAQKKEVTGTGTMAVDVSDAGSKGFDICVLATTDTLVTDTTRVWNEMDTIDFENRQPEYNPERGETLLDAAPVAVAMTRKVADKEQKVVVLGNADMIANGELLMARSGINAANYCMVMETFRFLSDDEFPIFAERKAGPDNELKYIDRGARKPVKWIFNFILPFAIVIAGAVVLIRRKSR